MKYSALDLFPVEVGTTPTQVLKHSVRVAQHAEKLGFSRYWVAEHHNMPSIATAAPEILIGHLAAHTTTLRIGAGGVMLPNHSALHVVEIFKTLEALYPGRIDLGIGRAPGTDPITSSALQRNDNVNQQIGELHAFIHGRFPPDHPYARIVVMPNDTPCPPMWMLGSTDAGAGIAAHLGIPFAFAGHFSMEHAERAFARYHHERSDQGQTILALSVICAPTDEEAEALAAPVRLAFARIRRGQLQPFPTVEQAQREPLSPSDRAAIAGFAEHMIVGGPQRVKQRIAALADKLRPDEIMLATTIADPEKRMRSHALTI